MATDLGTLLVRVGIRGVHDVTSGLQDISVAAQHTGKSIGMLDVAFGSLAGNLMTGALGALGRVPGMLMGAASYAVTLSNEFESIRVGLESITGSADKAARKFAFLKELAIVTEGTTLDLARAGMMVEGMGLRIEKVLPLIAKLTMGTQRTGEEYQKMAVGSIFGRMAQGQMPEIEAMSAFGIGKAALAEFGAKFGPNGEMMSTATEMLTALERLINTRFGRALDLAANTGKAKMSAMVDIWQQIVARFGDSLKAGLMPVFDRISQWLTWILNSGYLDNLAARLAAVFGTIGTNTLGPLDKIMATMLAMAERLPQLLKVAGEWFGTALTNATAGLMWMVDMLSSGAIGSRARAAALDAYAESGLSGNRKERRQDAAAWRSAAESQMNSAFVTRSLYAKQAAMGFAAIPDAAGIPERRDQILRAFGMMDKGGSKLPSDPDPGAGWGRTAAAITNTSTATRETARNTREIADNFRDLRGTMFGGGNRARGAVSSIEAQIALARALGYGIG
jgi:hypothetical protein